MGNLEIDLLKEIIGLKEVWLYTSRMIIIWGKSVTVPDFSLKCGKTWIIIDPIIESFENSYIEWNRIEIQQAHLRLDLIESLRADHVLIEGRHKVMKRALSSIDFPRPYVVKSIEIYKFTVSNSESESEIVEYDGCLVFNFNDGRSFAISSYQAPGGTLGFTMDKTEINKLTSLSSQRMLITEDNRST
jgi:hypothetical protein